MQEFKQRRVKLSGQTICFDSTGQSHTPSRPGGQFLGQSGVTALPQPVGMLSSPHAHAFRQRLDSPRPGYHFLGDQLAHHENRRYRVSPADF